jgi:hypothetical protein
VVVLQLAILPTDCSFVRIDDSIENLVAPTIKLIMEDPHTKKVGVAILGMVVLMCRWNPHSNGSPT